MDSEVPENKEKLKLYKYVDLGDKLCIDGYYEKALIEDPLCERSYYKTRKDTEKCKEGSTMEEVLSFYKNKYDEAIEKFLKSASYKHITQKENYTIDGYKVFIRKETDYYSGEYEYSYIIIYAECSRIETDEEYDKRMEKIKKQKINNANNKKKIAEDKKKKELEELERLMKKYPKEIKTK